MRLICPNCDAEYEVEDSAIPDTGRDVQCSNCGHAWFQLPPEIELALEQEDELFGQAAAADPTVAAAPSAVTEPPAAPAEDAAVLAAALKAEPSKVAVEPALPSDPPRRTLDDNLLTILREEAEREAAARRSEGSAIETQPDLGLAAPPAPPPSVPPATGSLAGAARRIAQMQGIDPDAPPPAPPRPATRRDLLPDIEEINSSLKGSETPVTAMGDERPGAAAEARGFRSGFALALFVAVMLLAAYVAAPQIKGQIPALAGGMDAYVAGVDGLRLWLDGAMRAATDMLRGMTAGEGGVAGG